MHRSSFIVLVSTSLWASGIASYGKEPVIDPGLISNEAKLAAAAIHLPEGFKPHDATYRLDRDEMFAQGVLATDCGFGPDGDFFIADWIEGWRR